MPPAGPQEQSASSLLLELPNHLLLAVLQCLAAADDHRSLFSAARAHSRLHQAAPQLVSSIRVRGTQQQVGDGLLYLSKHGQHIRSVSLRGYWGPRATVRQLPSMQQLHSLELNSLHVQLLPSPGYRGVLGHDGLSALKQLQIKGCRLLDGGQALAAGLAQLPCGLQHLSLDMVDGCGDSSFPSTVLRQFPQLTFLQLSRVAVFSPDGSPTLQPLQALTRLVDLRVAGEFGGSADALSGLCRLTRLEWWGPLFEPGALAGKSQLQHLEIDCCSLEGGVPAGAMLSHLQPLQQLTHLSLAGCLDIFNGPPPPAAYSALTASTKLQALCLNSFALPTDVWQHLFPAGRQLPHLTRLDVADLAHTTGGFAAAAPPGSCLVSCCPGLQHLEMPGLRECSQLELLAALTELRPGLHTLCLSGSDSGELLLQTTQLRQLTRLEYEGYFGGTFERFTASTKDGEPVWRQVLRCLLDHSACMDPAVTQLAAAALAVE